MIQVIWEFVAKPGAGGRFELVFGPGGAWSKLFGDDPGFQGTMVLRDTDEPRRYLIVELWGTVEEREQALEAQEDAHLALKSDLSAWVESEQELGAFRVMNRATVRPRPTSRRRSSR